jgi:epoxyqueuosine reductase
MTDQPTPAANAQLVKKAAQDAGFDLVGIAPAATPLTLGYFDAWLAADHHAGMAYLQRRKVAYAHPQHVLEGVCSVVMLAINYKQTPPGSPTSQPTPHPTAAPTPSAEKPDIKPARIASYALPPSDYHLTVKAKLQQVAEAISTTSPGCRTRTVVDTAPLLERDMARLAGLGWFGKNTLLINKRLGSFTFLGAVLTTAELSPDSPHETSHCGTCTRCLEACPTNAFPEPYVLNANRCISYWTIEHRGPIPQDIAAGIGNWLFGCDICQDVCPWNRKAPAAHDSTMQGAFPSEGIDPLAMLIQTSEQFAQQFSSTALSRTGWNGLRRNAAIVLGNHRDERARQPLTELLTDADAGVRAAAAYALEQLDTQST